MKIFVANKFKKENKRIKMSLQKFVPSSEKIY
jgi:hypothetical protein